MEKVKAQRLPAGRQGSEGRAATLFGQALVLALACGDCTMCGDAAFVMPKVGKELLHLQFIRIKT
ncbi:MAG: hypothetical protein RIB47_06995 [Cyclobacteriaceae bacterium]